MVVQTWAFELKFARGWPFRVRRLGCFEHLGDGGRVEMQFGTGDFREEVRRAGDGQQGWLKRQKITATSETRNQEKGDRGKQRN